MSRLISQGSLNYSVPPEIEKTVLSYIKKYDSYYDEAQREINYDNYSIYPTQKYGSDLEMPRGTGVSSRTESIVSKIILESGKIADARRMVRAIDNGILRASRTVSSPVNQKKMHSDLVNFFIGKQQNFSKSDGPIIGRREGTFKIYKTRAIYFIAVELGLIEIDKSIWLAERQLTRLYEYSPSENRYG